MPSNILLLLPLLGGYWFLHSFSYTRVRSQSLDGYRLLLESIAVGIGFCILAYLAVLGLDHWSSNLRTQWHHLTPEIPYLASVGGGALLALFGAYPLNWLFTICRLPAFRLRRMAMDRHGNELQRLLQQASSAEKMISVTLDNRKVYVGFVDSVPSLAPSSTHFVLTPCFSGYRDSSTLDLVFTVDYSNNYGAGGDSEPFKVVIALKDLKLAALFDPALYGRFEPSPTQPADSGTVS